MNNIGKRLREARISAGLTRQGLSWVSYIGQMTIYSIETGRSMPHAETLATIAQVLDISLDYLAGRQSFSVDGEIWDDTIAAMSPGQRLKAAITATGIPVKEIGVKPPRVYDFMNERRGFSVENAIKAADGLHISLDWLYGIKTEKGADNA